MAYSPVPTDSCFACQHTGILLRWRWFAEGCVGCIGILKDWLVDAVAATLVQKGTSLTEEAPTGRSAGSLAWAGLANSYYWIDQTRKIGGAYATQIFPFGDAKSLPLFFEFEQAVYRDKCSYVPGIALFTSSGY